MSSSPSQQGGEKRSEGALPPASRISALPTPRSRGPAGPSSAARDAERTIEILRGRIEEEFRISERFDSKGRQMFTLAAGFFAAVQAVAFGAFGNAGIARAERLVLVGFTLGAGIVLLLVGHRLANAEQPLKEGDLLPDDLVQWLESGESEEQVLLRQVGGLAQLAKSRAVNNTTRKERYDALQEIARWSLIASGVELLAAIVVRL